MIAAIFLALLTLSNAVADQSESFDSDTANLLRQDLQVEEALIWHLDHSGWAIKTNSRLLIFDYIERRKRPENYSLADGFVNPDEIKDLKVYLFTSHNHSDHYDQVIFEWEKIIPDITYIFGWKAGNNPDHIYCKPERETFQIDDMTVKTVVHNFDNIPEAAFLIEVDGLVIYHAGDHSHSKGAANNAFKSNIEYLVSLNKTVDIAFTPTWGGQDYMIESLKPRFTFPMHDSSSFHQYAKFAGRAKTRHLPTVIIAAERHGQLFQFKDKKISR